MNSREAQGISCSKFHVSDSHVNRLTAGREGRSAAACHCCGQNIRLIPKIFCEHVACTEIIGAGTSIWGNKLRSEQTEDVTEGARARRATQVNKANGYIASCGQLPPWAPCCNMIFPLIRDIGGARKSNDRSSEGLLIEPYCVNSFILLVIPKYSWVGSTPCDGPQLPIV
jgi:hypothetical protein